MSSKSLARVNWNTVESGYNNAVDRLSGSNVQRGKGTLAKVFNRFVEFLMADFPQRGEFSSPSEFIGMKLKLSGQLLS